MIARFGLLILCALSQGVYAGECETLLKYGVYDTSQTSSSSVRNQLAQRWLCESSAQDYASAKSNAINAGVGVDIFSLNFGNQTAESNFQSWKKSFCSSDFKSESQDAKFNQSIKKVSDNLANKFVQCLASPGFYAWVERDTDKTFSIHAKVNPLQDVVSTKIVSFSIVPHAVAASCSSNQLFSAGHRIGIAELVSTCTRDSQDEVQITINTGMKGYSIAIPKEAAAVQTHDYRKECLALDREACVKRSSEVRSTCAGTDLNCFRRAQCWTDQAMAIDNLPNIEASSGKASPQYQNAKPLDCNSQF